MLKVGRPPAQARERAGGRHRNRAQSYRPRRSDLHTQVLNVDPCACSYRVWDEVGGYGTRASSPLRQWADGGRPQIPLNDIEAVPENFTGVLTDGRPYYLKTQQGKTVPVILELDSAFAEKAKPNGPLLEQLKRDRNPDQTDQPQKRGDRIKKGVKKLAERAFPGRAQDKQGDEPGFQAAVRAATVGTIPIREPGRHLPPVSRATSPNALRRSAISSGR